MNYLTINKRSAVPLFIQIKEGILAAIHSEQLLPHDKLPTEAELCELFGISRPVVRQAYKELINEGYIIRQKGRGTFVKEAETKSCFFKELSNFNLDMISRGLTPSTDVLTCEVMPYQKSINDLLELTSDSPVLHLSRLRKGNNTPMVLVDSYIPLDLFPGLENANFKDRSLYDMFDSEYGIPVFEAHRLVDAIIVDDNTANLLEVRRKTAAHYVQTISVDYEGRVVELSYATYPGERNRFDIYVYRE